MGSSSLLNIQVFKKNDQLWAHIWLMSKIRIGPLIISPRAAKNYWFIRESNLEITHQKKYTGIQILSGGELEMI